VQKTPQKMFSQIQSPTRLDKNDLNKTTGENIKIFIGIRGMFKAKK
jgi:hypothetical protein